MSKTISIAVAMVVGLGTREVTAMHETGAEDWDVRWTANRIAGLAEIHDIPMTLAERHQAADELNGLVEDLMVAW